MFFETLLMVIFTTTARSIQEPAKGFSPAIVESMKTFFKSFVESGKRPPLKMCREFLQNKKISNKTDKQVQDKIFNLRVRH